VLEAERAGCMDFLSKAAGDSHGLVDFDDLYSKVNRALKFRKLLLENKRLRNKFQVENLIGGSRQMEEVLSLIQKVAATDCTVLIHGESGTGKELVARALHDLSPRNDHPMVAINCGGMPEQLLESELFGHKRGAFTNAFSDKPGLFEEANGGTLFLDEISTLPFPLQAKLLRTLQEREIRRVGENTTIKINVRIIAASNQSLPDMIRLGSFREDLYYRLSVIPIEVPPLRERTEDIPLLVNHFLKRSMVRQVDQTIQITPEALDILCAYRWPGNVRELQNVIERAIVLCDGRLIKNEDLPNKLREIVSKGEKNTSNFTEKRTNGDVAIPHSNPDEDLLPLNEIMANFEREYCARVLEKFNGDRKKAAEILKISVPAVYRKLKGG
jgi:DNA-binding NtrC family response regulator